MLYGDDDSGHVVTIPLMKNEDVNELQVDIGTHTSLYWCIKPVTVIRHAKQCMTAVLHQVISQA